MEQQEPRTSEAHETTSMLVKTAQATFRSRYKKNRTAWFIPEPPSLPRQGRRNQKPVSSRS